ncbi:MAG: metalloenzyme [Calditrichaeota bacterium]|nr:MAG: metalloenzyme [Calditrichota bacterium]
MSVLMIFIDGIGIGENDPDRNPFARFPHPIFSHFKDSPADTLPGDGLLVSTDVAMDVPGLPQSATGQTALLTGVNAAQALGHHRSGFPSPTLRKILQAHSVFLKLQKAGLTGTFANAFTPEYLRRPDGRLSATTWSVKVSSFPFRFLRPHLWQGTAISHDLTNRFLTTLGHRVPLRTPEEAAEILCRLVETVDFCLFEYFLTDVVGHSQDFAEAGMLLEALTRFLDRILLRFDRDRNLLLLTSDHGNFEDLSVSTHTRNAVPTMLWGAGRERVANAVARIEQITPAILDYLTQPGS